MNDCLQRLGEGDCKCIHIDQRFEFLTCCFHSFFSLIFFLSKSVGCDYANHGWCNNRWYVVYLCHWIPIHSSIAICSAAHTVRIPGKDADAVFGVHNCRFGGIHITHRLPSLRALWCGVPFHISTARLSIFRTNHRLCGWWVEFHYQDTRTNGIRCAYTAAVLLHAMFTTHSNYQVCSFSFRFLLSWGNFFTRRAKLLQKLIRLEIGTKRIFVNNLSLIREKVIKEQIDLRKISLIFHVPYATWQEGKANVLKLVEQFVFFIYFTRKRIEIEFEPHIHNSTDYNPILSLFSPLNLIDIESS